MRVTPSPAALTIAAALAALVLLVTPSSAGAGRWQRPVPGEVTRSFDYSPAAPFARGAHRGADLAAAPGESVRAGCTGRVAYAGPVPGGGAAVTLRCGDRRVTHLPLQRTTVQRGVRVRAGARIGTLAGGHAGLHLGVRTVGDPFGYEDPLALLPPATRPVPVPPLAAPAGPSSRRPIGPAAERPRPVADAEPPSIAARPAATATPATAPGRPLAPPLVWAGVAVAAFATAGTGAVVRGRRRRRPVAAPAQSHA
ncbi:MAG TPA: M23 family metallopeptidase [Solirubrobacteraceae bacterium]|jgi:hypothetical protein|nr:M23 family metallopeptidase [Solirubrobacteraceae bacterium]